MKKIILLVALIPTIAAADGRKPGKFLVNIPAYYYNDWEIHPGDTLTFSNGYKGAVESIGQFYVDKDIAAYAEVAGQFYNLDNSITKGVITRPAGIELKQDKANFDPNKMPLKDGRLYYETIVTVDGNPSKAELYERARAAFFKVFGQDKIHLDTENKEEGHLIGRMALPTYYSTCAMCSPTVVANNLLVDFGVKDGKYRMIFYSATDMDAMRTVALNGKEWAIKPLQIFDQQISVYQHLFKKEMVTPTVSNNW